MTIILLKMEKYIDIQINPIRLTLDGGRRLDKRTFEAKTLIERIRYNALIPNQALKVSYSRMLRINDIAQICTINSLNLN